MRPLMVVRLLIVRLGGSRTRLLPVKILSWQKTPLKRCGRRCVNQCSGSYGLGNGSRDRTRGCPSVRGRTWQMLTARFTARRLCWDSMDQLLVTQRLLLVALWNQCLTSSLQECGRTRGTNVGGFHVVKSLNESVTCSKIMTL